MSSQSQMGAALKMARTVAPVFKQKTSASHAADEAPQPFSQLARYLLEEYAFGALSAHQVQVIAQLSKADGLSHASIDKLAGL